MAIGGKLKRRFGRVGVLMGGPSTERKVSLKSGQAIYEAILESGMEVVSVDIKTDKRQENIRLIRSKRIESAFVALHGRFGEDGGIQKILEAIGIPYTGSGVSASKLAMDKIASRKIFEKSGLKVPRYKVLTKSSYNGKVPSGFHLPLVIKPATHGSSIGLSIIKDFKKFKKAAALAFKFDKRIIIEEYIKGRELTVGILDEKPLPVIEIVPKHFFFDYTAKYKKGLTDYIVPAELNKKVAWRVQEAGLLAHKLLGCFGCSRVDIILDQKNIPFILEVNTIPGFTSTSLLPKAAKKIGLDFNQLCLKLLNLAYEKK